MRFLEARDPNREKVTDADCAAKPDVTWPLIRTHPVTGKHSLYLNPKNALRVVETAKSGVKSGVTSGVKSGVTSGVKSGVTSGVNSGVGNGVGNGTRALQEDDSHLILNLTQRMIDEGTYSHKWLPVD